MSTVFFFSNKNYEWKYFFKYWFKKIWVQNIWINHWMFVSQSYSPPTLHCIYVDSHIFFSSHTWSYPWIDSFWQWMSIISFWECLPIMQLSCLPWNHQTPQPWGSFPICHYLPLQVWNISQSIGLFGTPVPRCGLIVSATLKYDLYSATLAIPPSNKLSPFHTQDGYLHGPHHREQTSSFKSSHANVWHLIQTLHGEKDTQQ